MVSLEDFIASTLVQLVRGAVRAQQQLGPGVHVNPRVPAEDPDLATMGVKEDRRHEIEFDLMLSADQESSGTGKAGVDIKVLGIATVNTGGEKASTTKTATVNRVKFTIPLEFDIVHIMGLERQKANLEKVNRLAVKQLLSNGKTKDEILKAVPGVTPELVQEIMELPLEDS